MKKVIRNEEIHDTVNVKNVDITTPIFAKKNGKIKGMLVKEDHGWVLRFPSGIGPGGHQWSRGVCIEAGLKFGFEFFTE